MMVKNVVVRLSVLALITWLCSSICVAQDPSETPEKETNQNPSVYEMGMKIMKEEGAAAGIKFFEERSVETGSLRSLFGLAWGYWSEGSLDDARLVCDYILGQSGNYIVKAHCRFLRGYIHLTLNEHKEAEIQFLMALAVYEEKERYDDLFMVNLGLAASHILAQDFEKGKDYLDKALVINEKAGQNLYHYYYLWSRLAFGKGDYSSALRYIRQSYLMSKEANDTENIAISLSDSGLYLMLTGDFEEGLRKTHEAHELIQKHSFINWSYYNAINFVLAYRCSRLDYSEYVNRVQSWVEEKQDQYLNALLEFVLEIECP